MTPLSCLTQLEHEAGSDIHHQQYRDESEFLSTAGTMAKWSPEDNAALLRLKDENPHMKWEIFQQTFYPHRSQSGVQQQYCTVLRRTQNPTLAPRKRARPSTPFDTSSSEGGDLPFARAEIDSDGTGEADSGNRPATRLRARQRNSSGLSRPKQRLSSRLSEPNPLKPNAESTGNNLSDAQGPGSSTDPASNVANRGNSKRLSLEADDDAKQDKEANNRHSLQLLNLDFWNYIFQEARQCDVERKKVRSFLQEKATLEIRLREKEAELKEKDAELKDKDAKLQDIRLRVQQIESDARSASEKPMAGLDSRRREKLKSAWNRVSTTCQNSITFATWQAEGMQEAVNTVQREMDIITKPLERQAVTPAGSTPADNSKQSNDEFLEELLGGLD